MPSAPKAADAFARLAVVGGLDALDAQGRHGVHVGDGPQPGLTGPGLAGHERDARGSGRPGTSSAARDARSGLRGRRTAT